MGAIAKTVGKMAGSVIPFVGPAMMAAEAIGGLIGKKKNKGGSDYGSGGYTPNPAYTRPLAEAGSSLLPMAQKGFQTAFDYYSPLASGDQQALATATASDAASVGRQTQQLTDRASRTMPRGGAQAAMIQQLPQQQMALGLGNRISAQQNAASSLVDIAGRAGGLGTNIFGNLLGNELGGKQLGIQGGYLDLANKQADRDWYGKIGGGIFDILTGSNPIGKDSPLGKLGGLIGIGGDKKLPTTFTNTGLRTPTFRP